MYSNTLIYLLGDSHAAPRITLGGSRSRQTDKDHLQNFSRVLLDVIPEATYVALRKRLPFQWFQAQHYDTANPFGDERHWQYRSLWTFDTRNDFLYHTNRHLRSRMPLSLLRDRAVSLADLEPLGRPVPPPLCLELKLDPEDSYWKPRVQIDENLRAFTHRLLRDFHHQWRHIFRNQFNLITLRVLARAIIRLSTLDFEVRENTGGTGERGVHVWVSQLPSWEPFETEFERIGNVNLVLCQDIFNGLARAKHHLLSQKSGANDGRKVRDKAESQVDYMVLSINHIMLCYATGPTSLMHTAPVPLFNGDYEIGSPSELALDYLLWGTASARPLIGTPLQSLPVEIQDMVLKRTSMGTVKAAQLGCLLGSGTQFLWKDGRLNVELTDRYYVRPSGMPVESLIWFGEYKSGIVYLARHMPSYQFGDS